MNRKVRERLRYINNSICFVSESFMRSTWCRTVSWSSVYCSSCGGVSCLSSCTRKYTMTTDDKTSEKKNTKTKCLTSTGISRLSWYIVSSIVSYSEFPSWLPIFQSWCISTIITSLIQRPCAQLSRWVFVVREYLVKRLPQLRTNACFQIVHVYMRAKLRLTFISLYYFTISVFDVSINQNKLHLVVLLKQYAYVFLSGYHTCVQWSSQVQ